MFIFKIAQNSPYRLWLQDIETHHWVSHSPALGWTQVSVCPCEAEEADQRLVKHILNLTIAAKLFLFVWMIISYNGQVELNDIEIHA